jgi:predicted alpha/beta hydrolase family esterase
MKGFYYNLFYYKNYFTCKLFPNYVANNITDLFFTPRNIPQQPYEAEFEKTTKHNILKIPTEGYKERAAKFEENNKERKDMKLNRIPELPSEITVLEFLPEENIEKKEATIICVHGWEGRGTNFYKFIPKLTSKGFRVLAPDFPMHGKTSGTETGCHAFGFSLNCILNYIKVPAILLVHSLGNGAACTNYYISDEKTRNQIKGFIGIGVPDKFSDYIRNFGNMMGLDDYTNNLFLEKNSERLGIDIKYFVVSDTIKNFNYPCLIVHDDKDKEVSIEWAINSSKYIQQKYQTYKIGDKEYPCLHKTSGLGHRRILRDDGVVDTVVDFISNIQI